MQKKKAKCKRESNLNRQISFMAAGLIISNIDEITLKHQKEMDSVPNGKAERFRQRPRFSLTFTA